MQFDPKRIKQLSDSVAAISMGRKVTAQKKITAIKTPYLVDYEVLKRLDADTETAKSVISIINSKDAVINKSSVKGIPNAETAESIAMKLNSRIGLLEPGAVKGIYTETPGTIAAKLNSTEGLIDAKVIKGMPKGAVPETAESIAIKLNSQSGLIEKGVIKDLPTLENLVAGVIKELKTGKTRLEAKDILNLPQTSPKKFNMSDQRWHGGGLSTVSHDSTLTGSGTPDDPLIVVGAGGSFTVVTTASTIDDSNVTFVFTAAPTLVAINGVFYQQSGGAYTWSIVGATVTLSAPIGTGGSIFGIR